MKQMIMIAWLASLCGTSLYAELQVEQDDTTDWYDAVQLGIQGKGWKETSEHYTRLPAMAQEVVPGPVWSLSQQSAGLFVRFRSDATSIKAAHHVTRRLSMLHMTTVGVSGLDLYARDAEGAWRWAGFSKPAANCYTNTLIGNLTAELRDYTLYLPLYNHTASLRVGVPTGSRFQLIEAASLPPVVYYGTSIAHGCSASRPGMAYTAILGRRLNRTFINLGFSGNGRMELALADLLAEIDAAAYVLDCVPNMSAEMVAERTLPFIRRLRSKRPETPVIMVGSRPLSNYWIKPDSYQQRSKNYHACYNQLMAEGFQKLTYVKGLSILGDDSEGTVDGSHPTDLGMWRQANVLEPILRSVLAP